jgi:hypothetical protein
MKGENDMDGGLERRDHGRQGLGLAVTVTGPDGAVARGTARDLGLGGVRLEGGPLLPPGTDCRVELGPPGADRARVAFLGRVARVLPGGMAIACTYIDADNHARLHELLASDAAPAGGE